MLSHNYPVRFAVRWFTTLLPMGNLIRQVTLAWLEAKWDIYIYMGYSGVQSELLDVLSGYNYGNNHHTLEYIYISYVYSLELKLNHSFMEKRPQGPQGNFQEHPSGCLFFRLVA